MVTVNICRPTSAARSRARCHIEKDVSIKWMMLGSVKIRWTWVRKSVSHSLHQTWAAPSLVGEKELPAVKAVTHDAVSQSKLLLEPFVMEEIPWKHRRLLLISGKTSQTSWKWSALSPVSAPPLTLRTRWGSADGRHVPTRWKQQQRVFSWRSPSPTHQASPSSFIIHWMIGQEKLRRV